jgi:hypothetical protein
MKRKKFNMVKPKKSKCSNSAPEHVYPLVGGGCKILKSKLVPDTN